MEETLLDYCVETGLLNDIPVIRIFNHSTGKYIGLRELSEWVDCVCEAMDVSEDE